MICLPWCVRNYLCALEVVIYFPLFFQCLALLASVLPCAVHVCRVPGRGVNPYRATGEMSDSSGTVNLGAMVLEEPDGRGGSGGREQAQAPARGGILRCGSCALWPRQQTWLCVVPLLIGFIGLGLSLMLLKWIVVGSVRDYVPTDLVDAKGIGQDPIFLSKPSTFPKGSDSTTTTTIGGISSASPTVTTVVRSRTRTGTPPNVPPRVGGASGSQVTQKSPSTRFVTRNPTFTTTVASTTTSTVHTSTSSPSPSNPAVLNDSTQMWTREKSSTERHVTTPGRTHVSHKTRKFDAFWLLLAGFCFGKRCVVLLLVGTVGDQTCFFFFVDCSFAWYS